LILIDTNLLLYAYNRDSPHQIAAESWLTGVISGSEQVRLPWQVLLGFVRISTDPRLFRRPLEPVEAIEIIRTWLEQPGVEVLEPGSHHLDSLAHFIMAGQTRGAMISDAHLAALAVEHGATLYSTDRDFSRFPGLRFKNPLES
jgi:uncharacterized protein